MPTALLIYTLVSYLIFVLILKDSLNKMKQGTDPFIVEGFKAFWKSDKGQDFKKKIFSPSMVLLWILAFLTLAPIAMPFMLLWKIDQYKDKKRTKKKNNEIQYPDNTLE